MPTGGHGGGDDVVEAARAGEEWALTALYRANQPSLLQFLRGLVGDDAHDVASEAWIDAGRALAQFRGSENEFRRLLFTIGRRRAVDLTRAHRRRRLAADQAATDGESLESDPLQMVVDADTAKRAARRIGELLPKDQAEVILLRVVGGMSVTEVAEVVGRSPATVSVLQSRGLRRLASRLGEGRHVGRELSPW